MEPPLHKPAVGRGGDETMQPGEVRRIRRWLWAVLGVRSAEWPMPAEAERWGGDSRLACSELRQVLHELSSAGEVAVTDARAWAADAALAGERTPRSSIAESLGLSIRGLDGRLAKVDKAVGVRLQASEPPTTTRTDAVEELVAALSAAAAATARGDRVASEAFRHIAQSQGGDGQPSHGGDRTQRMRALRRARAAVARVALVPPPLPRLQPLRPGPLLAMPYTLHDDPDAAVAELHRAWRSGDVDCYPLLIDHACAQAPSVSRAGTGTRLLLLEVVTNILRDTESLLALAASTRWLREAAAALGPFDRQVTAAARSRAHILQLHGYLRPAATILDGLLHHLPRVQYATEVDRRFELIDLLLRRAKVEVARREHADLDGIARSLAHVSGMPEAVNHPLPVRLQLHFTALRIQRERSPGTRLLRQYEAGQAAVLDRTAVSEGAQPFAMVDTVLTCALLVGQGNSFVEYLLRDHLSPLAAAPAWANQFDRMRQRLSADSGRRSTPNYAVEVPLVPHPLRVEGTLPTSPRYRV